MTPIQQLMLGVGASKKTYMDDVFGTYLYTGNATARSINNGIDLSSSGEGGMVWVKSRASTEPHCLFDTVRGVTKFVRSNESDAESTEAATLSAFNSNGFSLSTANRTNQANKEYASWSFRKAKGFFDVVTYTGTGSARTISHSLGSVPGCIMIKETSGTEGWRVYHTSKGNSYALELHHTTGGYSYNGWNNTTPTSTEFSLGTDSAVNSNGETYVAYVFAGGESTAATARSVDFDGNDALTLAASNDFHSTGDLTIEGWFNPDTLDDFLFCLGDKGGAYGVTVYLAGTDLKMEHSAALKMTVSGTPLPKGQWTHVALVKSGSTVRLYINGISRATYQDYMDWGGASDSQKTFTVGSGLSSGSPTEQFHGKISNFRFVKGTAVYTSSFRPPTKPLTNITNTKLLCCNNSSTTGSTVTPGTITASGDPTASTDSPFDDPAAHVFGESGSESVIKCGSYTGNGSSTGPEINLGWEPTWVMIKRIDSTSDWLIWDTMRGIVTGGTTSDPMLYPNASSAESTTIYRMDLTSTGFKLTSSNSAVNADGGEYIYMCIRRSDGYVGKPVETATDVFTMVAGVSIDSSGNPSYISNGVRDFGIFRKPASSESWNSFSRLTQGTNILLNATTDEATLSAHKAYFNNGMVESAAGDVTSYQGWMWKRHAGFDVVAYEGNSVQGRPIPHSLNAVPEMIWVKNRDGSDNWMVAHKGLDGGNAPFTHYLYLNTDAAEGDYTHWDDTAPTSTHFYVSGYSKNNGSGDKYISMLFSSVAGISSVGSYTGNGATDGSHAITVGFQPRFLIIKRVDASGEAWNVFDTLRGLGAGVNTLSLNINDSNGQTNQGSGKIGLSSTTFIPGSGGEAGWNVNSAKYIYYAHA